jgi:sigma-B regulation protein RsbU (phosphoserine phosphatase)
MEVAFSNNPQRNRRLKLTQNLKKNNSLVNQLTKQLAQRIYQSVLIKYDAYIGRTFAGISSLKNRDKSVNELDLSLQYRIIFFVKTKLLIFILSLIRLALFIESFLCFYSAVRQTVFVLDEALKKMASGNQAHKIILDNRDAQGQVVGAFNKTADALIGKTQEITVFNDRLKAENMRMISELDLTRKIQPELGSLTMNQTRLRF